VSNPKNNVNQYALIQNYDLIKVMIVDIFLKKILFFIKQFFLKRFLF